MKLVRRVTISVVLLVFLALLVAAACAAEVVQVGPPKNGKSVTLDRGDRLVVWLRGNATTGYAWSVKSVDKTVLKPLAVKYVPDPNPRHLVGSGGIYKLRFEAVAVGKTTLKLIYARGKDVGGSYKLRVVVTS